jgi:hypothetical protein
MTHLSDELTAHEHQELAKKLQQVEKEARQSAVIDHSPHTDPQDEHLPLWLMT